MQFKSKDSDEWTVRESKMIYHAKGKHKNGYINIRQNRFEDRLLPEIKGNNELYVLIRNTWSS